MSNKTIMLSALAALTVASASAQSLREGYIEWPNTHNLPQYVKDWNNGTLQMEDEAFFISRVKPKARFRNAATQIDPSLTAENDKRMCLWLPLTTALGGQYNLNALPNSLFDSEAFSTWSYVDHYGNWTAPHGWVPGAFADVAHKNGVGVSSVASVPFGGISSEWRSTFDAQTKLSGTDIAKFMYYHGCDGLGYNSEWSGYGASGLAQQHEDIIKYFESKGNMVGENVWYDGTTTGGACSFDQGLRDANAANFANNGARRASLFFNYNWNRTSLLNSSVNYAKNTSKVSPLYLYAGMNMQGGEPKSGDNYPVIKDYQISLGMWGAHQYNMFWLNRTAKGSQPEVTQNKYLQDTERFFNGGAQNPAVKFPIKTYRSHYPDSKFFGMCSFMSARSTLCWDLAEEPFVTYFNIGNGAFFNWKGERVSDQQWYNIGIQDYMPTWRYWWAPTLLGRDVAQDAVAMKSTITWSDAYVGGSCLQISGTDADAWLHLFKTKFTIQRNDVLTFTYKHIAGAGKVSLVFTLEGAESTPVTDSTISFDLSAPDDDAWQTKSVTINRGSFAAALNGKTVALIALHIEGAKDLVFNVGEFSIKRGTYETPATPVVTNAKLLREHYQGIDGKLFWDMASDKAAGEPVYNLDVKTSMFKLYAREEGGKPVFVGATSSWAGMFFSVPFSAEDNKNVQLGVSAVSLDGNSESEIAWSQAMAHPKYDVINDITIDKNVIKPLEGFTIRYVDPMHTPSTWAICSSTGQEMASATGTSITVKNGEGFAQTGGYDLVIDKGTAKEHRYGYYVQVSSEEVGAMPEIYTVSVNDKEASATDAPVNLELTEGTAATEPIVLSYTGRDADGAASRGLELRERFFGLNVGTLGITPGQSFSVAFWILYDEFPDKEWSLFDITNRGGSWPVSNWGYAWHRGNGDGQLFMTYRGSSGNGVSPGELNYTFKEGYGKVQAKTWTHIAFTVDYKDATHIRSHLYLNGVLQPATFQRAKGGGQGYFGVTGTEQDYADTKWDISANDWLSLGGLPNGGLAINGILDDFQVWSKAMTAADVKTSMAGLNPADLPADVMCLWDFEDEPQSDYGFLSKGAKPGIKAYSFDCVGGEDAKEGQGLQTPFEPNLSSGCPFISGTAYPIVTTPTWSTDKASSKKTVISDAKGNGEAGSAKVAFNAEGDYNINLTLANSYGKSTASYPVISVKTVTGLADVAAEMVEVHTDANGIFVDFPAEGRYTVSVFDVQGRTVAQRADQVNAGQMMHVNITTPGAYIVRVNDAEGNMLRAVKVIKH